MAYLVLARKYRPQRFVEVVGQESVVKTIVSAIKFQRLSHALLFAGIKGTGKTTLARIVAKSLNCEKRPPEEVEPCNTCNSCVEIMKGIHVDVVEIDAASNRGIDQVREIIEALKYAPAKGKAKVYIIDEAHMLTKEAANALLKSLEEPPPHVYFILATTEPNRLPPTILSRCQRYEFRRLEPKLLRKHLSYICELENYQMEREALELIVKASQGSLRDALSLLDQAMAYGVKTREDCLQSFGWYEEILFEDLARALLERNLPKTMQIIEILYQKGVDLLAFTERLTHFFRDLFFLKTTSLGPGKFDISDQVLPKDLILLGEKEDFLLIYETLYRGLEAMRRSNYPHFQFELLMIKICELEKFVSIERVLEKLSQINEAELRQELLLLETVQSTWQDEKEEKEPKIEESIEKKTLDEDEQLQNREIIKTKDEIDKEEEREILKEKERLSWEDFVKKLKEESPALATLLEGLPQPVENKEKLIFTLDEDYPLLTSAFREKFKEELWKHFGKEVEFLVKKKGNRMEEIKERPEVQAIMNIFSAKIISIKPVEG